MGVGAAENLTRRIVAELGDSSTVLHVSAERDALVPVAICHRSPAVQPMAQEALQVRYRRGENLPGRVWESDRGILIPVVDTRALEATAREETRAFVRATALASLMAVPIHSGGQVIGVLVSGRDQGSPPFGEDEFQRLTALADEYGATRG